nr:lyase family protein [Paracoccus sp. IB05]
MGHPHPAGAREIRDLGPGIGEEDDQIQGGAGTSTNMNANEVIANRALELMGRAKGEYPHLHPNEHVNLGQSPNDVCPTALRLATWTAIGRLLTALSDLRQAFRGPRAVMRDQPWRDGHRHRPDRASRLRRPCPRPS